jgi:membrane fusion protein (multidrug efflux system)
MRRSIWVAVVALSFVAPAAAQAPPAAPPAVGVVKAALRPVTETERFIGRIQAVEQVNLVARVTAFLEHIVFTEGQEVKKGDVLYRLEQPPFQADVAAKQATIEQIQAQLDNANVTLDRAQTLLKTPAGQQSTVDAAKASQGNLQGQLLAAQANLRTSEIELGYTTISAPIDGKIGRTAITVGNVVSPSSGTLATIVRQDPMYVVFPISVRSALELRRRYVGKGGFNAVQIKIVLPDGRTYGEIGKLNFADNTIAASTDTLVLRGTIANPPLAEQTPGSVSRELVDGEFIQVLLEGVEPVQVLTVPRAAISTDQQGDFVYVVGDDNKAIKQIVKLGQSTPTEASVISGLKEGQSVVVDGIQRVHPGQPVSPAPASPSPAEQAQKPAP